MKLKAVVPEQTPAGLITVMNGLRELVLKEVLVPHLHTPSDFGPAEFYVQVCDIAVSKELLCVVGLSGVSRNRNRCYNDFDRARDALEKIYQELIRAHLPKGQRMQLMVAIMLDSPRENGSALVEGDLCAIWVEGEA